MKKESTSLTIRGCEINLHFSHMRESNPSPENVERMLLEIGLQPYAPPEETAEQSS